MTSCRLADLTVSCGHDSYDEAMETNYVTAEIVTRSANALSSSHCCQCHIYLLNMQLQHAYLRKSAYEHVQSSLIETLYLLQFKTMVSIQKVCGVDQFSALISNSCSLLSSPGNLKGLTTLQGTRVKQMFSFSSQHESQ